MFRDEAPYLREWIEYHNMLGVSHFYLFNNLSSDNYKAVLTPYIDSGLVELIEWPYESKKATNIIDSYKDIQVAAYRAGLKLAKKSSMWLAIIDIDEFLVPVKGTNLLKFLAKYQDKDNIGGLCLPWVFYGTSHVKKIPENRLLIETLLLNGGAVAGGDQNGIFQSGAYKSIVRPKYVEALNSAHYCLYRPDRQHIQTGYDQALINHYWTRDEDFLYNKKIPLREIWGTDTQTVLDWAGGMNQNTPYGRSISRFIPELRKRMGMTP